MNRTDRLERAQIFGTVELEYGELAVLLAAASALEVDLDNPGPPWPLVADLWRLLHRLDPDLAESASRFAMDYGSATAIVATAELLTTLDNNQETKP